MKINIFTPTYHREEMTKRSIESIIKNVESSVNEVTLYICDNNSSNSLKEWLLLKASDKVTVCLESNNIGKAGIINKYYKIYNVCDYFISIDSDFISDEPYNFIDEMVICAEEFKEFGLLSTYQKDNDQQIWCRLDKEVTRKNHTISYGSYQGVAGGCIIMSKTNFDTVGLYSTYGGVYGYDDAILMQTVNNKLKLLTGVIKTVKLIHPYDEDNKYNKWKVNNMTKQRKKGYFESL